MATETLFNVTLDSRDRLFLVNSLNPGSYYLRYPTLPAERVLLAGVVEDVFLNEPFNGDWGVISVYKCWTRTTRVGVFTGSTVQRGLIYTPVRTGIQVQLIRVF